MDPSNPDPGIIKLIDRLVDEATCPEEETLYISSHLKADILVSASSSLITPRTKFVNDICVFITTKSC